jgi:hypothetical protein
MEQGLFLKGYGTQPFPEKLWDTAFPESQSFTKILV